MEPLKKFVRERCESIGIWLIAVSMRGEPNDKIMRHWHCGLARMARNAGAPEIGAHRWACVYMGQTFGVDVMASSWYKNLAQELREKNRRKTIAEKKEKQRRIDKREIKEFGTPII